jgi:hypothetical protein
MLDGRTVYVSAVRVSNFYNYNVKETVFWRIQLYPRFKKLRKLKEVLYLEIVFPVFL